MLIIYSLTRLLEPYVVNSDPRRVTVSRPRTVVVSNSNFVTSNAVLSVVTVDVRPTLSVRTVLFSYVREVQEGVTVPDLL